MYIMVQFLLQNKTALGGRDKISLQEWVSLLKIKSSSRLEKGRYASRPLLRVEILNWDPHHLLGCSTFFLMDLMNFGMNDPVLCLFCRSLST